jgi:hypothetical protein
MTDWWSIEPDLSYLSWECAGHAVGTALAPFDRAFPGHASEEQVDLVPGSQSGLGHDGLDGEAIEPGGTQSVEHEPPCF